MAKNILSVLSHAEYGNLEDSDIVSTTHPDTDANGGIPVGWRSTIRNGDRLELCGKLFNHGRLGIDWVHTNCGETPTAAKPNGWLKIMASDGTPGPNLENSQGYCWLWR